MTPTPELRTAPRAVRAPLARVVLAGGLLTLAAAGCDRGPQRLVPEVIRTLPHDTSAYTQGLVLHEGRFFESTGRYGHSQLREVDLETGRVLRSVALADEYFGEGLALVGDRLIQLTWQEGIAFEYDAATFELLRTFRYQGHGWGLCYDGTDLYMTSGGSMLVRRDPQTFEIRGTIQITVNGSPLWQVNELACVGDYIYGNVYPTDRIVRIRKSTGRVDAEIDGSRLVPPSGRFRDGDAVLNGIAYDAATDTFYLTGKLWSAMFQVRLVGP
jgi:glutaminyl-peptide cyclotransferase